ncbi:MAG: hypothetical protein JSV51_09040 [Candidatus Bathyarchaeota archaeon]|nr:MAG: hypothetical protein JSV51_09040 [Candidatus Bathyarchaeota archaeon]
MTTPDGHLEAWLYALGNWEFPEGYSDPTYGTHIENQSEMKMLCDDIQWELHWQTPYIPLWSRNLIIGYAPELEGWTDTFPHDIGNQYSPNFWDLIRLNWSATQKTSANIHQPYVPNNLHPTQYDSFSYSIKEVIFDKGVRVNPTTQEDSMWLVKNYAFQPFEGINPFGEYVNGSQITFNLHKPVVWHDSEVADAYDIKFCWDSLDEHEPSEYSDLWLTYVNSTVNSPTSITVWLNSTNKWLINVYTDTMFLLPPQIYNAFTGNTTAFEAFRPWEVDYTNHTENPKPAEYPELTCLIGVGPYVFVEWNTSLIHLTKNVWYSTSFDESPPFIEIVSPQNLTYQSSTIPLSFTLNESCQWIGYSLDDNENVTIGENTTLTGLSNGPHSIIVYAQDYFGNVGSSDLIFFTVDAVIDESPPSIDVLSPENSTYTTSSIPLTFVLNESCQWIGYSIDGGTNTTISGNTTLSGLSNGPHTLLVFAQDLSDNVGSSGLIAFTTSVETDLSLQSPDITYSNDNPNEGQTVTISARIHNSGGQTLSNIPVRFLDGNTTIGDQSIPIISHHSSATTSINWTAEHEGFHLIKVIIDPTNIINESSEENNIATRSLLVGEFPHFGTIILNATAHPTTIFVGNQTTISGVAIYNTTYSTGEPVAGADVTISIPGGYQYKTHTISNGSYSLTISSPHNAGNYTITVTVTDFTFSTNAQAALTVLPIIGVDLILSQDDIILVPEEPVENDIVSIIATIHNVGTINATNVLVSFFDDDLLIGNATIGLIPAEGAEPALVNWLAKPSRDHVITIIIDPENSIKEINEENNEASKEVYVYPALPDFTPVRIFFSDSTPTTDAEVTINADVTNIGGLDGHNVSVNFYDDGSPIGSVIEDVIPGKGGLRTVSLNYTFSSAGSHIICVFVDEPNDIAESDEGNNQYCVLVVPHPPLPDLTLQRWEITFSNSTPTAGDEITIYAQIRNIGEQAAANVSVEFFDGSTRVGVVTLLSVNSGSHEVANILWNATPEGWHQIKVIIDGNNTIIESVETNNVASRWLYAYPDVAPDPVIYSEDIIFSNTNPEPSERVLIYATIRNIGDLDAHNITVWFYVDDLQLGAPHHISFIPVDGNWNISAEWIAVDVGSHVVKVLIDTPLESDKNNNMATRALIVSIHDLSIIDVQVSKTIVGQGQFMNVTITVKNLGNTTETFDISLFANDVIMATNEFSIEAGLTELVELAWNTTILEKGNYTIKAYIPQVPSEVNLSNNILVDGWVFVTIFGDINGDTIVDITDITMTIAAFGKTSSSQGWFASEWYANCDVNDDGKIDITDITLVISHFGSRW